MKPISCIMPGDFDGRLLCGGMKVYELMPDDGSEYRDIQDVEVYRNNGVNSLIESILKIGDYILLFNLSGFVTVYYNDVIVRLQDINYAGFFSNKKGIVRSKTTATLVGHSVYYLDGTAYTLKKLLVYPSEDVQGGHSIETTTVLDALQSFSYDEISKMLYCVSIDNQRMIKATVNGKIIKTVSINNEYASSYFYALGRSCIVISDELRQDSQNTSDPIEPPKVKFEHLVTLYSNGLAIKYSHRLTDLRSAYNRITSVTISFNSALVFLFDMNMTHCSYLVTDNRLYLISRCQSNMPAVKPTQKSMVCLPLSLLAQYKKAEKCVEIMIGGISNNHMAMISKLTLRL